MAESQDSHRPFDYAAQSARRSAQGGAAEERVAQCGGLAPTLRLGDAKGAPLRLYSAALWAVLPRRRVAQCGGLAPTLRLGAAKGALLRLYSAALWVVLPRRRVAGSGMEHWVYIVRCSDQSYYTGITVSVSKRLDEHNAGVVPGYTHHRRPVTLVWAESVENELSALNLERQIKGWTRAKKEALIARDWKRLHDIVSEQRRLQDKQAMGRQDRERM